MTKRPTNYQPPGKTGDFVSDQGTFGIYHRGESSGCRILSCWDGEVIETDIADRARFPLDLKIYACENYAEEEGKVTLKLPRKKQYILRMLIKTPFNDYVIPEEYMWTKKVIEKAHKAQKEKSIRQPFVYLTIRHGVVESVTDDEWHVDGFSMQITHLPEQNYVWVNDNPTEYIVKSIVFPADFNPLKHNIHYFIQDQIAKDGAIEILQAKPEYLYCLDPYIIHKRPISSSGKQRTFIRISYTPIEIIDSNNTPNPLINWRVYTEDRVKAFRESLKDTRHIDRTTAQEDVHGIIN